MRVYVAGPYSAGDVAANVRRAISDADRLLTAGHSPYVPHLSHFWHLLYPHEYTRWMELDLAWVEVCEALIRLDGESMGADTEEGWARRKGVPIYYSVGKFLKGHE